MYQTETVEKIETHILRSVTFFPNDRTVYEIMWKNIVERGRPQMTIWPMRIACWGPWSTDTHSEYVMLIAFPLQQWLHERPQCYVIRTVPVLFLFGALPYRLLAVVYCVKGG